VLSRWPDITKGIQAVLGRTADRHSYTYTLWGSGAEPGGGAGIEVSAGGFTIRSDFTHVNECPGPDRDPGWTDSYTGQLYLGGPSIGLEGGADVVVVFYDAGTNDLITPGEWTRDDFECAFVNGELSGTVGYYAIGGAEGGEEKEAYTFIRIRDGALATGTGGGHTAQGGFGAKVGGSVGLKLQGGYYYWRAGKGPVPPDQPPPEPVPTPEVLGADRAQAYFDVDSSSLNLAAKTAILELALTYRALFENAGSYLVVEGDASRTASDDYNRGLSLRRTLAMYDYLHSLLSAPAIADRPPATALAVTDSHVMLTAWGESRPRWMGLPDDKENPDWRKATLFLAGRHLASLGAAAELYTPESQSEPTGGQSP
jgi:hypothetical protein